MNGTVDKLYDRKYNMTDFRVHGGRVDVAMLKQMVKWLRDFGPWWDRNKGMDHIFLYSWGRMPCSMFPKNLEELLVESNEHYDPELYKI